MRSDRGFEAEISFIVGGTAVICSFQIDGSKSHCRTVFLYYFAREPDEGVRAAMTGVRMMGLG